MRTNIPFCSMAALAGLAMALPSAVNARPLPFWQVATAVAEVNTLNPLNDGCPIESWDGLSLYIASNRPGSLGSNDIWASDRASKDEPFGEPQSLGAPVNTEYNDFCPTPIYGSYLLFVSERPGPETCNAGPASADRPVATGDIYMIRRNAAFGWGEPQHLGCAENGTGPNTTGAEFSPSLVKLNGGTYLYFSSTVSGNMDIYRSRLGRDGRFGAPEPVSELNTPFDDRMPDAADLACLRRLMRALITHQLGGASLRSWSLLAGTRPAD